MFTAGFSLPFLGYCFGAVAAYLLRRPIEDVIAISVETGLQNTGIAIFLLRFTLPQPDADLNTGMQKSYVSLDIEILDIYLFLV